MNVKELLNSLHDEGYSDRELGDMLGMSREYVNKVRNGLKPVTQSLATKIAGIASESPSLLSKQTPDTSLENTPENSQGSGLGWLFGLVCVVGMVLYFIYTGQRNS